MRFPTYTVIVAKDVTSWHAFLNADEPPFVGHQSITSTALDGTLLKHEVIRFTRFSSLYRALACLLRWKMRARRNPAYAVAFRFGAVERLHVALPVPGQVLAPRPPRERAMLWASPPCPPQWSQPVSQPRARR